MRKLLSITLLLLIFLSDGQAQNATNCFNTQFKNSATTKEDINGYLMGYLATMIYPDYGLRFHESPVQGPSSDWVKFFQHRNDTFVSKFAQRLGTMFYDPTTTITLAGTTSTVTVTNNLNLTLASSTAAPREPNVVSIASGKVIFDFQSRCNTNGYDPEAIIISNASTIFVVFRGTDRVSCADPTSPVSSTMGEVGEWLGTDFKFLKRTWPNINGEVHRGMIESLTSGGFADSLASRIKNKYGGANKKIWITGHSLGGAHAQLFALLLKLNYGLSTQGLYLYESPHPGDANFVNQLNTAIGRTRIQRFEFGDDPICTLPPQMAPFSYGRAGVRNYFEDLNVLKSGPEQLVVWDDMKAGCGLLNLGLSSTIKLDAVYACGGAFCHHDPRWVVKALRNKVPSSLYTSLPADLPIPTLNQSTCTTPQIEKAKLNNVVVNTADAIEKAVGDFIASTSNILDNVFGTVPGIPNGNYKIACYGFTRNNAKKYLYWNGTDKSQLTINTTGTVFTLEHKGTGGYYLRNGSRMVANVKVPNLGGPDARVNNNVLMQKSGNFPGGLFGDEDTWYFRQVSNNVYVLMNWNTKCILDAPNNCLSTGDCGVDNISSNTPGRTSMWVFERQ